MKKALLIVALAIVSIATASAQYDTTEYIMPAQVTEVIDVTSTTASPWLNVVWAVIVFYSLVVIVLTFKLFIMCDNVKELTKLVKNIEQTLNK